MTNKNLPSGGFIHILTILEVLWDKKLFIAITTFLGLIFGIYTLKSASFTHDIQLTLVPVNSTNQNVNGGLFGRLTISLFNLSLIHI